MINANHRTHFEQDARLFAIRLAELIVMLIMALWDCGAALINLAAVLVLVVIVTTSAIVNTIKSAMSRPNYIKVMA